VREEEMERIAMVVRKSPYGDINAAEALRHAMGGLAGELAVDIILVDGGVLLSMKNQDVTGTGFTNLGGALKNCIDSDLAVYADSASLSERRLEASDIIEGVRIVNAADIAELVQEAGTTMIF
jgi:sulfur relay (sulfurtransferase) DsrF/TusC family protein